jgi:hypothetical protein
MTGSIGKLAEEIVEGVKQNALLKIAQHEVVKEASQRPNPKTEVGKLLLKVAQDLRSKSEDVTVSDVQDFLNEVGHAG